MQRFRTIFQSIALPAALSLLLISRVSAQQNSSDPDSQMLLQGIESQVQMRSAAYGYLQELSDTIGPRLTGSVQAKAACVWAMQKMKHIGLQDVHLEPWRLSHSWQRGIATAKLIAPFQMPLNVTSYGWVGSTKPGGTEADVVLVNSDQLAEEVRLHYKSWQGKVLFLAPVSAKHANPVLVYSQLGALLAAAAKAHAVAVISSSGRPGIMLTHTGPASFRDAYYPTPVLDIAPEHQLLLQRLLVAKHPLRVKIDVENTVSPSSVLSSNVVGDIPGSEHPEEIVLIGAHLDSWDLGTGSVDDGVGVASVLAAADAIMAQQIRPKRTLRFVLFTGEEQGLLGSLAYTRTHKAELKNLLCAFILDWGTGPIAKLPLAGHDELASAFSHFTQVVNDPPNVKVDTTYLSFTDGYAFTLAGIPGIAPLQNSPNYILVGHSAADTLDKVDKRNLTQDAAYLGEIGFWMANYPSRLGIRWTPDQTIKALTRDSQKTLLELFGLWPGPPTPIKGR